MTSAPHPAASRDGESESMRNRILFLVAIWTIALLPFMLWRGTWFGRPLSDQQIGDYLHDNTNPERVRHALTQLADRMQRRDQGVINWYPDVVRLASFPVEDVRATAATLMGLDATRSDFHNALLHAVRDPSPAVRANAAASLAVFGDAAGHAELIGMLQPTFVVTHEPAHIVSVVKPGTNLRQFGTVAELRIASHDYTVRAPIAGRVVEVKYAAGADIPSSSAIATLEPSPDQQIQALRALYAVGEAEDLAIIQAIAARDGAPDKLRQQANLTVKSIRDRAVR